MLGFTNLLKSNFGDSATPLTSPLEPRLKSSQDAATAPLPPESFNTPVGERRVPRDKDPRKPNYEMIKDARKGVLSGFLRSGKIFCASDFVGIVNPKTAIVTLHDIYDFETRCLTTIDDQTISRPPLSSSVAFTRVANKEADDEKKLRNLFFISLADDELPSFHFWTKPGDLDPVTAAKPFDWGKHFDENPPSPATAAKIAKLENERKENAQRRADEQQNTQDTQPLGFLDHYNNVNMPALGREPTQGQPADDINSVPRTSAGPILAQSPLESEVLLQFNRGGMYLREFTHKALYAMACWLVENEEEEEESEAIKSSTEIRDMFLDILGPGKDLREEKIVSVSRVSNRNFQENIRPIFSRPDKYFRIRSTRYPSWWNLKSHFDSAGVGDLKYDLKLVRPNVGYCYCSANWDITGDLRSNSQRFEKALQFLFDWESSAYPKSDHLNLDILGHGSFDLDRNSDVAVDANIQKIFAELSGTLVKSDSHPAEIIVRDVVEDVTDGSDFLGTISPRHGNTKYETGAGKVPEGFQATEISGGPDLPSIYPRVLTNSEIEILQERLKILEASVIDTDDLQERLRVAEEKLTEMNGLQERLKTAENRARLKSSCPFCPQDWAGATKQQQQDHLRLHQKDIVYQPAPQKCPQPDCTCWLGENQNESTYETILEHLRNHIEEEHAEDGICEHQNCHANMYALTGEQQEEHESIHRIHEETKEMRDQLQERVKLLEDTAPDEHVTQLLDVAMERERLQEHIAEITEQRDSLQNRVEELERRLKAGSGLNEVEHTNQPEPETEVDEDFKQPSQSEAPKKLRYCNVCLKSVDKMSANAKTKHADKCETSVSEFLLLTPAEAKAERESRNNSRDVVRPQAQERTEEAEVPNAGNKKKQKAAGKTTPLESQQDAAEDTSTVQQPGASKTKGRKTSKRKIDTFKPPREDESDEELESPTKKPKLKAKAAKTDKQSTAPTRRSTRGKDIYDPPEEEEDEEKDGEEELSSSAKGGKRKKKTAAQTTVSKKAKTRK